MTPFPRPVYESDEDRQNERSVAAEIAETWGFHARKLPMQYRVDFALTSGPVVEAFLEVKARRNRSDAYPTLILSASKYEAALLLSRAHDVPVFFAVRWTDRLGVCLLEPSRILRLSFSGRDDRNDWQDREPCIELDPRAFVPPADLLTGGL